MGERALPRLLERIADAEVEMTEMARRLFARWLESVVQPAAGAAPSTIAAATNSALL